MTDESEKNNLVERATALRSRYAELKKLPYALRLMYAEKTLDDLVVLLCAVAAEIEVLNYDVSTLIERGSKNGG